MVRTINYTSFCITRREVVDVIISNHDPKLITYSAKTLSLLVKRMPGITADMQMHAYNNNYGPEIVIDGSPLL